MDDIDRAIVNSYQGGFPVTARPYRDAAAAVGIGEDEFIERISSLLATGVLSRFGPMYHAEKLGGGLTLAALAVPEADFDAVAEIVTGFPEVAHNYARAHHLNMWFVLATETPGRVGEVIAEIERATGLSVFDMPKEREFFVGLRFDA